MSIITGIRKALETDVVAIASIHACSWREVYHFLPDRVQASRDEAYRIGQWQRWFAEQPDGEALFALVDGDAVVGFAMAKPNRDLAIAVPGEFHACYILPEYRGGASGPMAMSALAEHLWTAGLWPACVWAFRNNPYRRIYPALGCVAEVFRDRDIAGLQIPEIGYRVADFATLLGRLSKMRQRAQQKGRQYRSRAKEPGSCSNIKPE
ncbi:GNAT family N-acetyltransferase [Roseibium litorale]|uniref:GNAT family N-acetyltransferase n=1 Tax=Roseibium litorale TaxID=2803841 RepID=A0ABR9CIS5_9HYPH|nr:GNAT family N-acetyltransferase [Roseibium litorale]MBD8890187.1 GNAT family N-acetyltransferase [Roseibium litorale]